MGSLKRFYVNSIRSILNLFDSVLSIHALLLRRQRLYPSSIFSECYSSLLRSLQSMCKQIRILSKLLKLRRHSPSPFILYLRVPKSSSGPQSHKPPTNPQSRPNRRHVADPYDSFIFTRDFLFSAI